MKKLFIFLLSFGLAGFVHAATWPSGGGGISQSTIISNIVNSTNVFTGGNTFQNGIGIGGSPSIFQTTGTQINFVVSASTPVIFQSSRTLMGTLTGTGNAFEIQFTTQASSFSNLSSQFHISGSYGARMGDVGVVTYEEFTNTAVGGTPGAGHLPIHVTRGYDVQGTSTPMISFESRLDVQGQPSFYYGNWSLPIYTTNSAIGYSGIVAGYVAEPRITSDGVSAPSSTGTAYGFYAKTIVGGKNHWAFYNEGPSDFNIFMGTVAIGTTAPTQHLHMRTAAQSATDQILMQSSGTQVAVVLSVNDNLGGYGSVGTTSLHPFGILSNSVIEITVSSSIVKWNNSASSPTIAGGPGIYATGNEMYALDGGGNATKFSPHIGMNLALNSLNYTTHKAIFFDLEKFYTNPWARFFLEPEISYYDKRVSKKIDSLMRESNNRIFALQQSGKLQKIPKIDSLRQETIRAFEGAGY